MPALSEILLRQSSTVKDLLAVENKKLLAQISRVRNHLRIIAFLQNVFAGWA